MPPGPQEPQVPPRQPGETYYAYRKRRSVALTGMTPYQRRMVSGRARGLTAAEARGHVTAGGQTEYQRRRQRTLEQTGLTPYQLWRSRQVTWLTENGFTPETTGWTWGKLVRAAPWLRYLNSHASPGAQVLPVMLLEAKEMEQSGLLESEWSFTRLRQRYRDTKEYLEAGSAESGRFHWFHDRIPEMPVAWWFYH